MSDLYFSIERLIQCRKNLGITKLEASKRCQLSQPAYLRYEAGQRNPSIHVMTKMAEVFGTSVAYLTCETDDPAPDALVVYRDQEKELFYLVERYRNSDAEAKLRLATYMQKLLEGKEQ